MEKRGKSLFCGGQILVENVPSRYKGKDSADALSAGKESTEEGIFWFSVSKRRGTECIGVRISKVLSYCSMFRVEKSSVLFAYSSMLWVLCSFPVGKRPE
jgi:hypothetical protein